MVAESTEFDPKQFELTTKSPLKIGVGSHDHLNGKLKDVRLYDGAISAEEVAKLAKK